MQRLTIIVALAVAALMGASASAHAAVYGDWGAYAALAQTFRVPLPDAYVHRAECPDAPAQMEVAACSASDSHDIWIPDDSLDRFTLAHELGHQFDEQYLTDPDRAWLRRVMRAPGGDWFGYYGADEWFADYYADCATRAYLHHSSSEVYADHPSVHRLLRVCNAISALAQLRG